MRVTRWIFSLIVAMVAAIASPGADAATAASDETSRAETAPVSSFVEGTTVLAQNRKQRRRRNRNRRRRRRQRRRQQRLRRQQQIQKQREQERREQEQRQQVPANEPEEESPPASGSPDAVEPPPVLDLSDVEDDTEEAKQELLLDPDASVAEDEGGFDFGSESELGSGESELSFEEIELDLATMGGDTPEKARFDAALELMSDEEYEAAAVEFRSFVEDDAFANFKDESQYQLAKALYKLGFLDSSLNRYREILETGPTHSRFRKSIEWLFFISRKVADQIPVLAELAKFRNVKFPAAYSNEFNFLMAKYLFLQANQFAIERRNAEQLAQLKEGTEEFDFSELEAAIESDGGFDFSGGGFDFGDEADGGSSGGNGVDFGGSQESEAQAFDFGGGEGESNADGVVRQELPTTEKEAIKLALEYAAQVEEDSRFYPEGVYLVGVLNYLDGSDQVAVDSFQQVVRLLDPRSADRLDPELREASFLQLARIHYEYKQFDKSAYYFDQVDRDSDRWLSSLYEASWAYYQRGDFEKALGNLLTLHSPFFEQEYFPESKLVKAIIYYEACRYRETREIIDSFLQRFTRVMQEIEKVAVSKEDPRALYERISRLKNPESVSDDEDVATRLVNLALSDPDIKVARSVVEQLQAQQQLWSETSDEFRQSQLGAELQDELSSLEEERSIAAGEETRATFERELYALKDLLGQAIRIKIEVTRSEREAIEKRLRGEQVSDEIVPAVAQTVVDDERLYWPYEGEYWRDELGNYELDFSMCQPLAQR